MALVAFEFRGVWLYRLAIPQKDEAYRVAWQLRDEGFRILDHGTDTTVQRPHVDGLIGGQGMELLRCEAAVACDLCQQLLRRYSWEAANSGANDRPEWQNALMNRNEVNHIAGLSPIRRGGCLVGRQVDGVEDVAEQIVGQHREEPKVGIRDPFEQGVFAVQRYDRISLAGSRSTPRHRVAGSAQGSGVGFCRSFQTLDGILEDVDIRGKPRAIPVDRYATGNVAIGAALRGQDAKDIRLKATEWHGKVA